MVQPGKEHPGHESGNYGAGRDVAYTKQAGGDNGCGEKSPSVGESGEQEPSEEDLFRKGRQQYDDEEARQTLQNGLGKSSGARMSWPKKVTMKPYTAVNARLARNTSNVSRAPLFSDGMSPRALQDLPYLRRPNFQTPKINSTSSATESRMTTGAGTDPATCATMPAMMRRSRVPNTSSRMAPAASLRFQGTALYLEVVGSV